MLPKAALKPSQHTQTYSEAHKALRSAYAPAEEGAKQTQRERAFPYRTARRSAHMPTGTAAPWGCSLPSLPCHSSSRACGSTWERIKGRVWAQASCMFCSGAFARTPGVLHSRTT